MAKIIVKCPYCNKQFDRNNPEIKWIKIGRRYAHQKCYEEHQKNLTQEEKDEQTFYKKTSQLFGKEYNYILTKKLAQRYIKENNYTYSGMTKALIWFYEINANDVENANGTIGIMPYIYKDAYMYYYKLYQAGQKNNQKKVNNKTITISVRPPQREISPRRLWFYKEDLTDGSEIH